MSGLPERPFPANLTTAAQGLIEVLAEVEPHYRAVLICFDPLDTTALSLDSNGAAVDLVPVLQSVLRRLEGGSLRMPLNGGVRWG